MDVAAAELVAELVAEEELDEEAVADGVLELDGLESGHENKVIAVTRISPFWVGDPGELMEGKAPDVQPLTVRGLQ